VPRKMPGEGNRPRRRARAPEGVRITPRRIAVDFGPVPPAPDDWYGGDAAVTEVFHALSATFPAGEAFFIHAVRHYERQLRDDHPELWEDVVLFFKQEALHSAQHEKWNRRIEEEYGHPMEDLERSVDEMMQMQKRYLCPLTQLACTACFEHFTATFGRVLLQSKDGLRNMRAPQRRSKLSPLPPPHLVSLSPPTHPPPSFPRVSLLCPFFQPSTLASERCMSLE